MIKHSLYFVLILFSSTVYGQTNVPKAAVSVIVDGKNYTHVRDVIEEAKMLSKKVPVRNLLLIQKMPDLSSIPNKKELSTAEQMKIQAETNALQKNMEEVRNLNLEQSEGKSDLSLLKTLRISYSPTWVVRYNGRNYIYEGHRSIDQYFTSKGIFKDGK